MADIVRKNALGVVFRARIVEAGTRAPIDVSVAATKQLRFTKPDGTVVTKTASFTTNGLDGQIQYTAEASFLNQSGFWNYEGYIVFTGGFDGPTSDTAYFEVRD